MDKAHHHHHPSDGRGFAGATDQGLYLESHQVIIEAKQEYVPITSLGTTGLMMDHYCGCFRFILFF